MSVFRLWETEVAAEVRIGEVVFKFILTVISSWIAVLITLYLNDSDVGWNDLLHQSLKLQQFFVVLVNRIEILLLVLQGEVVVQQKQDKDKMAGHISVKYSIAHAHKNIFENEEKQKKLAVGNSHAINHHVQTHRIFNAYQHRLLRNLIDGIL